MLKFPYGNSDFYQVSTQGFFYIDRTDRIPLLENAGQQLLFLRPRRFGKTLLLSMLENYYDVAKADEFERIFGLWAIGKTPTSLHNRYLVMSWDFSNVDSSGDTESIKQALYTHVNDRIDRFATRYQKFFSRPIVINAQNAISSFESALTALQQTPYKLYLLIDEYDNFANEVLMASRDLGRQRYDELVKGEGVFKTLFKAVKSASSGQGLERVFITGVSPVVMADISSGYNISENIYLLPEFNTLSGFTVDETVNALRQVAHHCGWAETKIAEAAQIMRTFYNGYCFSSKAAELVYNPTMALYFLKTLQRACEYPEEILDENMAMDRNRLFYVSQMKGAEPLITDALNVENSLAVATLAHRFGVADLLEGEKQREFLIALLYYLGVLTLAGRTESGKLSLQIPNLVVRRLYADRLREMLLPGGHTQDMGKAAAELLYQQGELQSLCDFVEQKLLNTLDNRDYLHANELTIKMAFLTLLFEDRFFIVDSEPELARGYGDLLMLIRPDMRQYKLFDILLEFKFLKQSEIGLDRTNLHQKNNSELKALDAVQKKFTAAKMQLGDYRAALNQKYGPSLRLRTYAVVALGFERLVWEEM